MGTRTKKPAIIEQNCERITGTHEDQTFFRCTFKHLRGLTLKNCDLHGSKFLTDKLEDALDFTVTMDCMSFNDIELSPLLFDLMLLMLIKTKGNVEKRKKLIEAIGEDKVLQYLTELKSLER